MSQMHVTQTKRQIKIGVSQIQNICNSKQNDTSKKQYVSNIEHMQLKQNGRLKINVSQIQKTYNSNKTVDKKIMCHKYRNHAAETKQPDKTNVHHIQNTCNSNKTTAQKTMAFHPKTQETETKAKTTQIKHKQPK